MEDLKRPKGALKIVNGFATTALTTLFHIRNVDNNEFMFLCYVDISSCVCIIYNIYDIYDHKYDISSSCSSYNLYVFNHSSNDQHKLDFTWDTDPDRHLCNILDVHFIGFLSK